MDEVVVTSRSDITSDSFTSSHEIINETELEQQVEVLEVLRKTPGIYVDQTGGPGSQAAIHIRGSEVRHVLVLIDGVKVFDPSNTDRHFNAAFLNLTDVERIEVLKGAQSHLYGADAIGGVINIITQKKTGKHFTEFGASYGAFNSIETSLARAINQTGSLYLNTFYQQSKLISAAAGGKEKDGVQNQGVTVNWGQAIGANLWSSLLIKNQKNEVDTDAAAFVDDASSRSLEQQQIYSWSLEYENTNYQLKSQLAINRHDRESISDFGVYPFFGQNISWEGNLSSELNGHAVTVGVRAEQEQISTKDINKRAIDMFGAHLQYFFKSPEYFANTGLRGDFHQSFGAVGNLGFGFGRHFGKVWTLKSQVASGFKAPSLYQLYAQDLGAPFNCRVGNVLLAPEKSRSLDLGLLYHLKNLEVESTFFYNDISDYIDYQCDKGYQNVTNYHSHGLEMALQSELSHALDVGVSLTVARFERDNNLEVPRRPNIQAQFSLDYDALEHITLSLQHRFVGKRYDYVNSDQYILGEYQLTNLNIYLKRNKRQWQLMVHNLFDQNYQEVAGYNKPGLNTSIRFNSKF